MTEEVTAEAKRRLEIAQQSIGEWRRNRVKHGRMPVELWNEATALARVLGINRVSQVLNINHGQLSRRTHETGGDKGEPAKASLSHFLEVKPEPVAEEGGSNSVIELSTASGARLTIRLGSTSRVDLGALLVNFSARWQ